MALPITADVIVTWGYWWDESTGAGVGSTVTFDPVPLGNLKTTPNLRDLTAKGWIKTRQRIAAVDPTTGYFATIMVASNDPDLDPYGGRKVTFAGETPFVVEVPYNAPTLTVDTTMAQATGLTQGATVRGLPLSELALVTTPTPSPSVSYLTSSQTLASIVSGIESHDEDPDAHSGAIAALKQWAAVPDALIVGTVTRDANGAATSAGVVWPNGTPGTYTATTVSSSFPGAVDAYTVTYGSPPVRTYTQPAVTRNASGAVTTRPAITVA